MFQDEFIDRLKWLGRNEFVFDLGINYHAAGKWQLREALEMVEKAHGVVDEEDKVAFIFSKLSNSFYFTSSVSNEYLSRPSLQARSLDPRSDGSSFHGMADSNA